MVVELSCSPGLTVAVSILFQARNLNLGTVAGNVATTGLDGVGRAGIECTAGLYLQALAHRSKPVLLVLD